MFRLACGLYDQLEVFAMRGNRVEITYLKGDYEIKEEGVISDIVARNGVEKIIFNNEKEIETADILSVNGIDFKE